MSIIIAKINIKWHVKVNIEVCLMLDICSLRSRLSWGFFCGFFSAGASSNKGHLSAKRREGEATIYRYLECHPLKEGWWYIYYSNYTKGNNLAKLLCTYPQGQRLGS